ncbi:hypoxanthine phosphoribosyltransferase [Verrucomicrobiaceae bacterium N1E253]|uniref:Hypoxanthine phosphoribosyltransferase n=1 Tax=Oceaniferula marina TaxID=2748318 RepID=A0A851GJJ2_9BACT|nr:hypoxanthine phosphoribosyltransferase [Oceaniferula marina]NWK56041.1 hypoxanthine phosphoribosyltransferase [Oceaniferula marina]
MHEDIEKVLIDEDVIRRRLVVLAERIIADFEGKPMVAVALLKGAVLFVADLIRHIPLPMEFELLNVSSYHGGLKSSGEVLFLDNHQPDLHGKHVLLLDDILDTGLTMEAVTKKLKDQGAEDVKTCVLLAKDIPRDTVKEADYTGFVIANEFVVGYGLDYQDRYRNLPYVGILKEEVISS